jgi:dsDNA-binding SOS-regulon protein
MAQYSITYACGCTGTVNLIGSHSSREWKLARLTNEICFACYKEQQLQAAQAATKERELVPLLGTEKQINWAMSIRIKILDELERLETRLAQSEVSPEEGQLTLLVMDALYKVDSAHQWIEWRDWGIGMILRDLKQKLLAAPTPARVAQQQREAMEQALAEAAALAEATLRPEQPVTETLAEITCTEHAVRVRFPENREDFNSLVRGLGYTWDGDSHRWERTLRVDRTGPARERAIELGHILLSHSFCVCAFDHDLRAAIIAGAFEPEQTRWIAVLMTGDLAGWFYIQWGTREDYYEVARRIHLSRYHRPFVAAPPVSFDKVLDFAERYDFRLTERAQEVAKQAREQREAMLVVKKEKPVSRVTRTVASTVPPVLAVPERVEVAEEFSDADHD